MICHSLVLALALFAPASARPAITPSASALANTPTGALQALAAAYSEKSLEKVAGLFANDYQFSSTSMESVAVMQNFGRDRELQTTGALFHGLVMNGKLVQPGADSIRIRIAGGSEAADPEHPDSVATYRLVAVRDFTFRIFVPGMDTLEATPALHVFHLVRGDAAVLAAGQSADTTRWYIRRWLEDMSGLAIALAKQKGDCEPQPVKRARGEEKLPATPMSPLALAIHALGNPACPTMDVMCDLPSTESARLEVYDIMGRRVNQQTIAIGAAGTQRLQAGVGADIKPGAYWIRLTQGRRHATRMIVVAK